VEINGVILDKVLFLIFIFYNIKMNNLELNPCSACMKKYDMDIWTVCTNQPIKNLKSDLNSWKPMPRTMV
jgi:hypothetical protein